MDSLLHWEFEAIGTQWVVDVFTAQSDFSLENLKQAVSERIAEYDKNYSRFRNDSLVAEISRTAGGYVLPGDAQPLFDLYHQLYILSKGKVTPLIGSLLEDLGYDATYSFVMGEVVRPLSWNQALTYNYPNLTVHVPVLLDLGAAGKGYLVDIISELLVSLGVTAYCVDAGGDMRHAHPTEPLRVGLEHPHALDKAVGIAQLSTMALAGSAGNRRAWGDFHHIIDPETLSSPQHIAAVWVIAETALLADALTTALYFVEPARLREVYSFEYVVMRADSTVDVSDAFPGELFFATS